MPPPRPGPQTMPKPFDAATKQLVESNPEAWVRYLGLAGSSARVVDTDVSAVTAATDRVLRVEGAASPYIVHIEFQVGHDDALASRLLHYNALLAYRHRLPVQTVVVLLHRAADSPAARAGRFDYQTPHPDGFLRFGFRAVRVWEQNAADLLAGDLATLPLAPISNVKRGALPEVVRAMESRLGAEATAEQSGIFWSATYLLLGLRYKPAFINELLKGVRQLKESSTYQFILAEGEAKGRVEGRAEGERALILQLGSKRFGPPDAATQATLDAITTTERLERLAERLLEVESWAELLTKEN